jgi:hypothetical protein
LAHPLENVFIFMGIIGLLTATIRWTTAWAFRTQSRNHFHYVLSIAISCFAGLSTLASGFLNLFVEDYFHWFTNYLVEMPLWWRYHAPDIFSAFVIPELIFYFIQLKTPTTLKQTTLYSHRKPLDSSG